jgi:phenylalanyl-tRNA synthetase beta chain
VLVEEREIGWLGELHPRWQQKYELPLAPVLFELDVPSWDLLPKYRGVSKFPPIIRDLAMEFEESLPVAEVLEELTRNRPVLVQEIRLFDVFRGRNLGRGRKSLAFRVVMQDTARTLTDADADAAMAQLKGLLSAKFGAKLRT